MRGIAIAVLVLALGAAGGVVEALQSEAAQARLEAARKIEVIDGDLAGAIKQYQAIVDEFKGRDRAAAAQALLRMASCYQRQGNARAQAVYQQIIDDYADQSDAVAQARSGLGRPDASGRTSAGSHLAERTLWAGADLPKGDIVAVSPDSRLVAYVRLGDGGDGALVVRDVSTGRDRVLTSAPGPITRENGQYAVSAAFSRDGRRVAYDWRLQDLKAGANRATVVDELRVVDLMQPDIPTPRVVYRDEQTGGYGVAPVDWFPDGERIVVLIGHGGDGTRELGIVSARDGKLTTLRALAGARPNRVAVSPDGRFLAYDLPADATTAQRDVFVLSADGSRQVTAVGGPTRDQVVGWSPDGARLLFVRDEIQLWAQPMADGNPQGQPSMLKADARGLKFNLTAAGDLFEVAEIDDRSFYRIPVDFSTGKALGPAVAVPSVWPASFVTDWSPDGASMASLYDVADDLVLAVQSLKGGDTHVVSLPLSFFDNNNFRWAPDGRSLLARATDTNRRSGLFSVDVTNGSAKPVLIASPANNYTRPQFSKDASKLYYIRGGTPTGAGGVPNSDGRFYVERDQATGREREIVKLDRPNAYYGGVSPDNRYVGAMNVSKKSGSGPAPDAAWTFSIISTADGTEKEVFRANPPIEFYGGPSSEWTPDGRFLVVRKVVGDGGEVWSIPVAGGEAHKLDFGSLNYTGKQIRISPDGRQIVIQAGQPTRREVRLIEHFLPGAGR